MSSMDRINSPFLALLALPALTASTPLYAQASTVWEQAQQSMVARAPTRIGQAISRWEQLDSTPNLGFSAYAEFLVAYPDFPRTEKLQRRAEQALGDVLLDPAEIVAFFDTHPPLTNPARARYALALASLGRPEASAVGRAAWRGGTMSGPTELYLENLYGMTFTAEDQTARIQALIWQDDLAAAKRQSARISAEDRALFDARIAILEGDLERSGSMRVSADARSDPGFTYDLARHYRETRQTGMAANLLATRPAFSRPAFNPDDLVTEMLAVAKTASASEAIAIASKVDDIFAPGTDISEGSFRLRDKYTDLMWLGGTKALWTMGNGRAAAPLFYLYGMAAKTPLTRSKGLYWAGRASQQAGERAEAERYYALAGQYADQYYGQLALDALGQPMPQFASFPSAAPTPDDAAAFAASSLVPAMRDIANNRRSWKTERAFFEAVSESADTPGKMVLAGNLARELGLNEFAVVAGATAPENGLSGFERLGHPTVPTPYGIDWTMSHAIMRQESEFDRTRVSHAGARGMMQLMPGTAREQAGKMGMTYMSAGLIDDTQYNIRLGDAYFRRMLDYYGGAYPLAIGAYNAGPGRVNQWLRLNGDPRTGAIDYVTWIEKIPANFETRYYIMRVLGNAVAYDNMNPDKAPGGRPRRVSDFLR